MTREEREAKEARFKILCNEQSDQCSECPIRPMEICSYKLVDQFSDDELNMAVNQLEKFGTKPTEAKMTREELKAKFEKLCDSSKGCDGCPCEHLRICSETLDKVTDADYEEGIKALEDYEKGKIDKSIGDGSKILLQATEEPIQGSEYDVVSKPRHYASTSIECIDAMRETQGDEAVKAYCVCNAFKYLWRHNRKNGDEDIKKANWYLNKAVEIMEGGQNAK